MTNTATALNLSRRLVATAAAIALASGFALAGAVAPNAHALPPDLECGGYGQCEG